MTTARKVGALGLGIGLVVAGCERAPKTPLQDGAGHFARMCASCHGPQGTGSQLTGFEPPPRNLADPTFQDSLTDLELREKIEAGKGQMPAFKGILTTEQLDHVVLFLRTLKQPAK